MGGGGAKKNNKKALKMTRFFFRAFIKQPPKKGEDLKRCSRCQFTRYCSEQCQRKDWDFHRFACSVVAKKSDIVKA